MSIYWTIGCRSIARHARRNFATGMAVACGYVAVLLLAGYMVRVDNYLAMSTIYLQHTGHFQIYHRDGLRKRLIKPQEFNLSFLEQQKISAALAENPNVEIVAQFLTGQGLIGNGCRSFPFVITGLDAQTERKIRNHSMVTSIIPSLSGVLKGLPPWESSESSISVAKDLARLLGKNALAGNSISAPRELNCESAETSDQIARDASVQVIATSYRGGIAGFEGEIGSHFSTGFAPTDQVSVQASLSKVKELFETDTVSFISVYLHRSEDTDAAISLFRERMKRDGIDVDIYPWYDQRISPNYAQGHAVLVFTVAFVAVIVGVLVVLSILNALTIAIVEARTEIGSLRSLGFQPHHIMWIHLFEMGSVVALALGAGVVIAQGIASAIASLHLPFRLPGMAIPMDFQLTAASHHFVGFGIIFLLLALVVTRIVVKSYAARSILNLLDRGA